MTDKTPSDKPSSDKSSNKTSTKVVIDRIEDETAVIVLYEDDSVKFHLPVKYLPQDAQEGDHFEMSFAHDRESREAEKKRVADLLKDLTGKKGQDPPASAEK